MKKFIILLVVTSTFSCANSLKNRASVGLKTERNINSVREFDQDLIKLVKDSELCDERATQDLVLDCRVAVVNQASILMEKEIKKVNELYRSAYTFSDLNILNKSQDSFLKFLSFECSFESIIMREPVYKSSMNCNLGKRIERIQDLRYANTIIDLDLLNRW